VIPLPAGFRVDIDADTERIDDTTLFGGAPARFMRLSGAGRSAMAELLAGPVTSPAAGVLARRLTDAGLAHPRPPSPTGPPDVTVIIPVRDRTAMLDRCLTALGGAHRVVVVDDGSRDATAVADVVARHGATLVTRPDSGGPAAARNAGLADVTSDLVAFVDSDCVPPRGWIDVLATHFADPAVGAVAPRVVALPSATTAGRYAAVSGSLDLGDRAARVVPGTRVAYVPTAALLVRRRALTDLRFDPALRYGEDVDLVWRLHAAGWRIRYDPSVRVAHREPETWRALLVRRFHYGTSAGPLATRHPAAMAPLALLPWPALTVAGLLAGCPPLAGLAFGAAVLDMRRRLTDADLPPHGTVRAALRAVWRTWLGFGRYGTQFCLPLLVAALFPRGRWAVASLLAGRPLVAYVTRRPDLDPLRFALAGVADDVAYGAGVWTGCVRARTTVPVRPVVVRRH
jgi:mycofactocin system glycosyltransferase